MNVNCECQLHIYVLTFSLDLPNMHTVRFKPGLKAETPGALEGIFQYYPAQIRLGH
jgi:hypothetical protein